jgi:hypothetical protein
MEEENLVCGIIMPISAIDGCDKGHWIDVKEIVSEAIRTAGFDPHLVSDSDESGIIQKRIVQNLYDNPIAVCDVSGKNPNVMFELGMRLAFDKPTIILKDDSTSYSFDTAAIEHVEYPRDLKYSSINIFKEILSEKIRMTYEAAKKDSSYTTFLKHFGEFTVAKINQKEVPSEAYLIELVENISKTILILSNRVDSMSVSNRNRLTHHENLREQINNRKLIVEVNTSSVLSMKNLSDRISALNGVLGVDYHFKDDSKQNSIIVAIESNENVGEMSKKINTIINEYK